MDAEIRLDDIEADHVFDGGDLDCGSGLVLLIRNAMLEVPSNGILELRSRDPSVGADLPPWCRMVGHDLLGSIPTNDGARYFIRKNDSPQERAALEEDLQKARTYEWRVRSRASGHLASTVYCRNFSFKVGQAASFEEKDAHPSAVEVLLGALGASLSTAYASDCSRAGLAVDDVEVTVRGGLDNVLSHLGLEQGDPSMQHLKVKCFASSFDDETKLIQTWEQTCRRSPVLATLRKALSIESKLVIA